MTTHPKSQQADIEGTPTPAQARVMFDQNAGLSAVSTTEGVLHRDGTFEPPANLQSHANMLVTGQGPRPGERTGQSPEAVFRGE